MQTPTPSSKPYLLRVFRHRPQLLFSVFLGGVTYLLSSYSTIDMTSTRAILSWNVGIITYILLAVHVMLNSNHEKMNHRAFLLDEGKFLILFLVILSVSFAVSAIFVELSIAKKTQGAIRFASVLLAISTIFFSWIFTHLMFALHYAHNYYVSKKRDGNGGLHFPKEEWPDYFDFLYFSFVIGAAAQTADVDFISKPMRKVGLIHCVLAFFFNATLLALSINIIASSFF